MTGAPINLDDLTEDERDRLEAVLDSLPDNQLLSDVQWEAVAEAVRQPREATVAGLRAELKRKRDATVSCVLDL